MFAKYSAAAARLLRGTTNSPIFSRYFVFVARPGRFTTPFYFSAYGRSNDEKCGNGWKYQWQGKKEAIDKKCSLFTIN